MPKNKLAVHFSSKSDNWATPQDFFEVCEKEYGPFDLDACASEENAKVLPYLRAEDNGLTHPWHIFGNRIWCNPPYGRGLYEWVKKGFTEALFNGCTVVMLLPARTDTKWFHDFCLQGEIRFIKGRLKFGGSKNSAPFPSMVVIFRPRNNTRGPQS